MIASSLALALGMSVASATATCGASGTPAICLDSNTTDQSSSFGITWTDSSGYKAVQSENQAINNLVFQFGDSIGHSVSTSNGKKVLTATTNSNSLSLYGNSASIQLDQLKVDFGNNTNKSFTLDLSNIATTSNFAFSGDIAVNGSSETNSFSATLGGKGLQWSIDIDSKGTNSFVFTENGSVSRIWAKKGTNTYTFNKDITIASDSEVIYAGWWGDDDNQAKNTFIFKKNTTIKNTKENKPDGNENGVAIWLNGNLGTTRNNTYNHMTFSGDTNKIIGKIVAVSNNNTIATQLGENLLTFDNNTVTNTIQGEISSSFGYNTITLNGTTNTITGNIVSSPFGTNTIKFGNSASANKIEGNITASGTNRTVETQGGLNELTFSGTTNTITGSIIASGDTASAGTNRVNFTNGTSSITQNIEAYSGGKNEITSSTNLNVGQIVIKETVAPSEHDVAKNTITFSGDTLTVSNGISTKGKWASDGINDIKMTKANSRLTISDKGLTTRKTNDPNTYSYTQQNIITFSNGGALTLSGSGSTTDDTGFDFGGILARDYNKNNITFNGNNNATINVINSKILAKNNGENNLVFNGTGINSINTDIEIDSNGKNHITLNNGTNLILKGKAGGTTHQITSVTATQSGTSTLTLDNSSVTSGAMTTTIHSITNGGNLAVVLDSKGTSEGVSLSFTSATALKSVTLAGAEGNALTFNAGANSVTEKINVGDTQNLTLTLAGTTTSLNLAGGLSGGAISVSTTYGVLSGGAIDGASITFADSKKLTLKNTSAVFTTVDASSASTSAKLTIGGSDKNSTNATISKLNGGDNLSVEFNGQGAGKGATLSILADNTNNKTITLKNVSVANDSTNNTLDLSSLSTVGIGSAVSLADGTGLTLKLKDTNLTVTGGTDSRITDEAKGALTIRVDSGVGSTSTATSSLVTSQTNEKLSITNLDMVGSGTTKVTFKSNAEIGTLTAQTSAGNELTIGESGDTTVTINTTNSTLSSVTLAGDTADLQIKGGTQTINNLVTTATTANKLTLSNNNLTLGTITNTDSKAINVELTKSTLSLASSSTINSLVTDGNSVINLAVGHIGSNVVSKAGQSKSNAPVRNKLTITTLSGNLSANVFVSRNLTDQIVINNATQSDTLTLYARGNAGEIISITSDDNVLVADTSGGGAKGKLVVEGGVSDIGGLVIKLNVKEKTQGSGLWYVGDTKVEGVDKSFQEVASSALAVNYDLYLANFNSLDKRMGELRDNPYSQGVWARVFGGAMSNDIGSGSKTQYVTAQAGYDYSLTLGNAKNYMGIAVAYGTSVTKANEGVGLSNAFLDNINSQMAEVGIYNSYVMDSGWYNDTIFKFDYIMSDFDISVQSGGTSSHSTNNFAMVLSDEFGYRYKFAESEKGNWYIDPQVEVAFGYFNQSDFNQAIADNFATVEASQDAILTLRTRAGMSLGKKFNTAKGFASLYVGAFYEYDYIEGGNAQTQVLTATNSIDRVESNGRAIVNIGSNIELTEGVRMYIDVEKSFGDKQRTDMQFNFGARYSFGEKTPTISYQEAQKRRVAPLKVEDK